MNKTEDQRATAKQVELLRRKGVPEPELENLTKKEASTRMDKIFSAEGQGQSKQLLDPRIQLTVLLQASDGIMQHIESTAMDQQPADSIPGIPRHPRVRLTNPTHKATIGKNLQQKATHIGLGAWKSDKTPDF